MVMLVAGGWCWAGVAATRGQREGDNGSFNSGSSGSSPQAALVFSQITKPCHDIYCIWNWNHRNNTAIFRYSLEIYISTQKIANSSFLCLLKIAAIWYLLKYTFHQKVVSVDAAYNQVHLDTSFSVCQVKWKCIHTSIYLWIHTAWHFNG